MDTADSFNKVFIVSISCMGLSRVRERGRALQLIHLQQTNSLFPDYLNTEHLSSDLPVVLQCIVAQRVKGWRLQYKSLLSLLCCVVTDTFPLDCAALALEHFSPLKADKVRLESLQSRASLS